jgi:EAL domain-containing protein (putative c-di-GMP-specific phosphodiesterase class I)
MTLLGELRAALGTGQLVLHYQPIFELDGGAIACAEALVRWERPGHGLVAPGDFIELAEQAGLIVAIGREVLEGACAQAREWQDEPGAPRAVSVNVSARQLIDPGFVTGVEQALQSSGLSPRRLILEITETALMRDPDAVAVRLCELRALGVRAALDDFGTGYSSLSYLRDLPVEFLKVARPFVAQIERSEQDLALVRSIVELGGGLGLGVVAEGIETEAQAAALRELACPYGQGFLLGRPSPVALGRAPAPPPETPSDLRSPGRVFPETATGARPATGVSGSRALSTGSLSTSGGLGSGLGGGRCMPPMTGCTGAGLRTGAGAAAGAGATTARRRRRRWVPVPSSSSRTTPPRSAPLTRGRRTELSTTPARGTRSQSLPTSSERAGCVGSMKSLLSPLRT